jgi:DNA-binding MarR family transcriptional regulator
MENHELIHTLHQLSRQLMNRLNEELQKHGLYHAQWSVIYTLKTKGSLTQKQLCEYLAVEAPPLTRTIQRLVKQDYVIQIQGRDRREKYIELTDKSLKEYPIWEKAVLDINKTLLDPMPSSSQQVLYELLHTWLKQLPQ